MNKQPVTRRRDYARAPAGHGVLARRPRAGEGRPGAAGATTSTSCSRRAGRGTRRCAPTSSGCCGSATRCCAAGSATPRRARPSTCSTTGWPRAGGELVRGRLRLVERLTPGIARGVRVAGRRDAGDGDAVRGRVVRGRARRRAGSTTSSDLLRAALGASAAARSTAASRSSARTATTGGCVLNGLDARSHASQGEQRTLALALRLAGHRLVADDHRRATRCSSSTTCSASSTRRGRPRWSRTCPRPRRCSRPPGVVPPGIDAERQLDGRTRARSSTVSRRDERRATSRCRADRRRARRDPARVRHGRARRRSTRSTAAWAELVGAALAAHRRPQTVRGGRAGGRSRTPRRGPASSAIWTRCSSTRIAEELPAVTVREVRVAVAREPGARGLKSRARETGTCPVRSGRLQAVAIGP